MAKQETIGFTLNAELLNEIDSFIPEVYHSRKEFMRAAVRNYIESEGERLFLKREQDVYIKLEPKTATKLKNFCELSGEDYKTILDKALANYETVLAISDGFASLDRLLGEKKDE